MRIVESNINKSVVCFKQFAHIFLPLYSDMAPDRDVCGHSFPSHPLELSAFAQAAVLDKGLRIKSVICVFQIRTASKKLQTSPNHSKLLPNLCGKPVWSQPKSALQNVLSGNKNNTKPTCQRGTRWGCLCCACG